MIIDTNFFGPPPAIPSMGEQWKDGPAVRILPVQMPERLLSGPMLFGMVSTRRD